MSGDDELIAVLIGCATKPADKDSLTVAYRHRQEVWVVVGRQQDSPKCGMLLGAGCAPFCKESWTHRVWNDGIGNGSYGTPKAT